MASVRPRPASISIPTSATTWRRVRPPTPRRATHPLPSQCPSHEGVVPPLPPLSFWDPDTPSPFTLLPPSPINPFLKLPQSLAKSNANSLLYRALPLLPASPLSLFDQALSPTAVTFLHSSTPTPTCARPTFLLSASRSPSPRFMCPRTPPAHERKMLVYDEVLDTTVRKSSVASLARSKTAIRLDFYQFLLLKKHREIEVLDRPDESGKRSGEGDWKVKRLIRSLFGEKGVHADGKMTRSSLGKRPIKLLSRRQRLAVVPMPLRG